MMSESKREMRLDYKGKKILFRIQSLELKDGGFIVPVQLTFKDFWEAFVSTQQKAEENADNF